MSTIPSNLARVPNLLVSSMQLRNLTRTNVQFVNVQSQLATGRRVNRPSDDASAAAQIGVLDSDLERSEQRVRNLQHAGSVLDVTDSALSEISRILLEAQGIASSQIQSDAETRDAQAVVIESLLTELQAQANREFLGLHVFGGNRTAEPPIVEQLGGLRYGGQGEGLLTDLGGGLHIPVTTNAEEALGSLSARVRGQRDLTPELTEATRISDLNGARGVGATLGVIQFSYDGSSFVSVDLARADTVGDVMDMIGAAIAEYEDDSGETVLEGSRISLSGEQIVFDMASGGGALVFQDVAASMTAADLGLTQTDFQDGVNENGAELNPRVTSLTAISAIPGLTALGSIRITNGGQTRIVDFSAAETLEDVKNAIEAEQLGVRVEISEGGTGIDLLNEWSGAHLSVAEVDDGFGQTAETLGIRTLIGATPLTDYNFGRGVDVVSGNVDPMTGLPDPTRDVDFTITLADGSSFDVNLHPEDTTTQAVIDRINSEAAAAEAAGDIAAGSFTASLGIEVNAIVFNDATGGAGQLDVAAQNGSFAAENLGFMDGTWDAGSATFTGEDRTTVRVDSAFSTLMALRDALRRNDVRGITFAGERLVEDVDRAAKARALVGGRANRVQIATEREEDRQVQTISVRSQLRDLDYTEASIRFNLLQTQLQAGLMSVAQSTQLSLLNFLG
ncbi:MAG: hypothetical protein KAS72_05855 [Phycisphaerales bacterium]|nr:hypothetical protein [Phycisphaerales bacterium]